VFENESTARSILRPHLSRLARRPCLSRPSSRAYRLHIRPIRSRAFGSRKKPDQAYELSLRSRQSAMVDPYTGQVLGLRDHEKSFARLVHLLHTRFVAGDVGEKMVGPDSRL